jgi:hypothetical protein
MDELTAYRQDLLAALESVVAELYKTVLSIPIKTWHLPAGTDSRTPLYTLAHLRELDGKLFAIQLRRILDEDTPLLPVFDADASMERHYNPKGPARIIMEDIASLRKLELIWLRKLPATAWSRSARHSWWGVHAFQWWVELQLDYSYQHLREISRGLDV